MNKKIKSLLCIILSLVMLSAVAVTAFAETSFSYRFDDKHDKLLADYPDFASIVNEELSSTPVPGVEKTKMGEDLYCYNMVPQGFCFAGEYMLITAYDYEKEFNSVIYVLSNDDVYNRELLTVIVTEDMNHVGGIACDGEYVYIARSSDETLGVISLDTIRNATATDVSAVPYLAMAETDCTASSVSYYDGKLWVGTFQETWFSTLRGFTVEVKDGVPVLTETDKIYVPFKTQGVEFFDVEEKTYLAVSSSYGRNNKANLYVFEITETENGIAKSFCNKFVMPPLTEEIGLYNGYMYLITEGAATEYTSTDCRNTDAPLDRVAAFATEKLIAPNTNASVFDNILAVIETEFCEIMLKLEAIFANFF